MKSGLKSVAGAVFLAATGTAALADGMPSDAAAPRRSQSKEGAASHEHAGGEIRHVHRLGMMVGQKGMMQSHAMAQMKHGAGHRKGGGC